MSIFSFGEYIDGRSYKALNERVVRGAAGIMFLVGIIAFIYGFIVQKYEVLPWLSGFMALNFFIGVFINPKFAPVTFVSWFMVRKQSPLHIGAVQKRFAWSLGLTLTSTIFVLSLFLLTDASLFGLVCSLCIICLALLFIETAFGICVGCQLYKLSLKLKLIAKPKERPNCMGDACKTDPE
jgi:hypothetical protein